MDDRLAAFTKALIMISFVNVLFGKGVIASGAFTSLLLARRGLAFRAALC